MGQSKALLDFHGKPWLRAQLDDIRCQTSGPIRVVLGPASLAEAALCDRLPGVSVWVNPDPDLGPFSSLQAGLAGLSGPAFAGPLDCPVTPVLAELQAAMAAGDEAVVPTHLGRGGHPVLLGQSLVARLLSMDPAHPEARLDRQLRLARARRLEVMDSRVSLNLNRPEDFERYRNLPLAPHHPGGE